MAVEYKKTSAKIHNYQLWIEECTPEVLKQVYQENLENAGFTIISFVEHFFEKKGYTCFWLLAESHLAIHTFPEENKTYVELSSCNPGKLAAFKKKQFSST